MHQDILLEEIAETLDRIDALEDEIKKLRKQLAIEKARGDELAAQKHGWAPAVEQATAAPGETR